MLPWTKKNYSHSYRKGRRGGNDQTICFETGYFGLEIQKDDLTSVPFKIFDEAGPEGDISYNECLMEENRARMEDMVKEDLVIEVQLSDKDVETKTYRAVSGKDRPRLWESGKICQHYDFRELEFDKPGLEGILHCALNVVIWPDSVTFATDVRYDDQQEGISELLKNGISVKMAFKDWRVEKSFLLSKYFYDEEHDNRDDHPARRKFSTNLNCDLNNERKAMTDGRSDHGVKISVQINPAPPNQFQSRFNKRFNCFSLHKKKGDLIRTFKAGYTDIRDYDDFKLTVTNSMKDDSYVPVLLAVKQLANPTGVCPQICDENGKPTGIPIQLTKNWHNRKLMGNYGRFYCLLPVQAMKTTIYRVRVIYGFYGSLPSASHANLCLVGYGGHGTRWEQLAIGTWGETYCMDVDTGCNDKVVTDLRMLMTKGVDEKKWMWTDAGWGGDWLVLARPDGEEKKFYPYQWKCAYNSHGPCLTEVQYAGFYGPPKVASVDATVRTLRCDDYARTFTSLKYCFNETVPFSTASFFELGTTRHIVTPVVVYGNRSGLIGGVHVPAELKDGQYFIENKLLEGEGPWWFGFPKQQQLNNRTWGKGWRGLIIRSFRGYFGGKEYKNPSISFRHHHRRRDGRPNLTFILAPPSGMTSFDRGDQVSFDVEVVTFPKKSTDYYGPNDNFRHHLETHGNTWKSVHREVEGNNINVKIHTGGSLKSKYPIVIASDGSSENIEFEVVGGLGAVPVRFDGMQTVVTYELNRIIDDTNDEIPLEKNVKDVNAGSVRKEQEVHGSDHYQVEFDASTNTYSLAFNIILDDLPTSRWILCKQTDEL